MATADLLRARVAAKERIADGVVALELEDPDGERLPDWTPGSHIDLVLPGDGGRTVRQYSLCGSRWDPHRYRLAILRTGPGGAAAYIHDTLRVGDRVGIGGPRNTFPLLPGERYLFVAGGIGITPLLPMIHQAVLTSADWRLVYVGRSRAAMAFADELAVHPDSVDLVTRDTRARPNLATPLADGGPGLRVYCCGPDSLQSEVDELCRASPGVLLRTERFRVADPPAAVRSEPAEVVLARLGRSVTVPPQVALLDALHAAGVDVLASCGRGLCGTCETTVVGGRVEHRDAILTREERALGDRMYPCVSGPAGDTLVLDL